MKKTYLTPAVNVEEVKVEKGFAVSDAFGIQDFEYEGGEGNENSAW